MLRRWGDGVTPIGGELDDAIKNSVVRCIAARGATEATKDSALVAIILNDEGLPAARAFHEALESGATEALKAMRGANRAISPCRRARSSLIQTPLSPLRCAWPESREFLKDSY